jgi:hypothetical protein
MGTNPLVQKRIKNTSMVQERVWVSTDKYNRIRTNYIVKGTLQENKTYGCGNKSLLWEH